MAKGDIKIVDAGGHNVVPTWNWQTEAAATAIKAGEPVKLKAAGSPYVIPLADDDLTIGTDTAMVGVAASDGTHTASADGSIEVYLPLAGVVYEMKATTAANVDTEAEINALRGDRVTMDLIAGVYTLDENVGDGVNNAFYIVGGDASNRTLRFSIRVDATALGA